MKKKKLDKELTYKELLDIDLERMERIISKKIYEAASIFKDLEYAHRLKAYGNQVAAKIANYAVERLREYWKDNFKEKAQ